MPDRRQNDRRQGPKKVAISLSNFIYICVIFVIIMASIYLCAYTYNLGYNDGFDEAANQSAEEAAQNYGLGYDEGYALGVSEASNASNQYIKTTSMLFFNMLLFFILHSLNFLSYLFF